MTCCRYRCDYYTNHSKSCQQEFYVILLTVDTLSYFENYEANSIYSIILAKNYNLTVIPILMNNLKSTACYSPEL